MSVENEAAWLWAAKCAGAVAGSAVSLAYMLPTGRHDAAARFVTGITCGLVFGSAAGLKIAKELQIGGLLGPTEIMLMGSATASLCAWWMLGLLRQLLRAAPRPKKGDGEGGEFG